MVATSFPSGRKFVNQMQWKLIHKGGVYFLWAYPFSVYWWDLTYSEPKLYQYILYLTGFLAFTLRIAAWGKKRQQVSKNKNSESSTSFTLKALGGVIIAFGLFAAATGMYWQKSVTAFLTAPAWSAELELWLPFWPFEPFLAIFIIGLGTQLATRVRAQVETAN